MSFQPYSVPGLGRLMPTLLGQDEVCLFWEGPKCLYLALSPALRSGPLGKATAIKNWITQQEALLASFPPGDGPQLMGLLPYEMRHFFEDLPGQHELLSQDPAQEKSLEQCQFSAALFDVYWLWDGQAWDLKQYPESGLAGFEQRLAQHQRLSPGMSTESYCPELSPLSGQSLSSDDEHGQGIVKVKEAIASGEVYQANLTRACQGQVSADPVTLFARVMALAPAPRMGLWRQGDFAVVSASPEAFVSARGDQLQTFPIKGTRPRRHDRGQDEAEKESLIQSPKDRAELTMIVDVMRNDFSRICQAGSVDVPALISLESFAQVHHLVGHVRGRLSSAGSLWSLWQALFPGASITGAPRVAAMKLIDCLEKQKRGPYTGSFFRLGPGFHYESNILIRTLVLQGEDWSFHVGGGIVWDSQVQTEVDETWHKAQGLLDVLGLAEENIRA